MSPPHGFWWCPIGPLLLVFLVVDALSHSSVYSSSSRNPRGGCRSSHNLGWHECKQWFPFSQLPAMGIFVQMLTKPLPPSGLELAPSYCVVCPYLKFCCGGLSCGESVLRHVTLFFRASQHGIMLFQQALVNPVNAFCLSEESIPIFLLLITLWISSKEKPFS